MKKNYVSLVKRQTSGTNSWSSTKRQKKTQHKVIHRKSCGKAETVSYAREAAASN